MEKDFGGQQTEVGKSSGAERGERIAIGTSGGINSIDLTESVPVS